MQLFWENIIGIWNVPYSHRERGHGLNFPNVKDKVEVKRKKGITILPFYQKIRRIALVTERLKLFCNRENEMVNILLKCRTAGKNL